ncbi:MAG: DNA translocase FtsK, partial [Bacteroidaceae bacterium]|nr:DNA translocase FtsK [Bacteroidaceae bacterium]
GKIKANFPARMAFRVMGVRESAIILDEKGANNLIGRGDMLILNQGTATRVQCAFVDTPEVEAIAEYIADQQGYPYPFELPLVAEESGDVGEANFSGGGSTFEEVARFVVNTQQGSTSKIQRTFKVGFNRAGRLMDQLEEVGIVGPVNGSKPREVYVQSEMELQQILDNLKEQGKSFD